MISGVETPPLLDGDGNAQVGGYPEETNGNGIKTIGGSGEHFRETWLRLDDFRNGASGGADGEIEIEELIISELVARHTVWIEAI